MAIQKQSYMITGMRQDNLVNTGNSQSFAHEIKNMRVNTVGDYTASAWTTEEGTLQKNINWVDITGDVAKVFLLNNNGTIIPIGQSVINDVWVVFTIIQYQTVSYDCIFKFWYEQDSDELSGTILFIGQLNFSTSNPIETLPYYENEEIQKVYWVDGRNQPRVINIVNVKSRTQIPSQFDFIQEVSLKEVVEIEKDKSGAGLFPPCTVKYAITYYNKYGQETNVVYDSPLYYAITNDKGSSPDELSGDSFRIKIKNIDKAHGFDYIRIYSIVRTTENSTPVVKIVKDTAITKDLQEVVFLDTNTTGEIVDPTILQFVGGKEILADTFAQKSNTLFLGNIELKTKSAVSILQDAGLYRSVDLDESENVESHHYYILDSSTPVEFTDSEHNEGAIFCIRKSRDFDFYEYINQMNLHYNEANGFITNGNSHRIKIFKTGEWYRFGIQFQDNKGIWSDVIALNDVKQTHKLLTGNGDFNVVKSIAKYQLSNDVKNIMLKNGYVKVRMVCCYTSNIDRSVIAQGLLNPTVYNNEKREAHSPDVMSSWFFRPNESRNDRNGLYSLSYKNDEPLGYFNGDSGSALMKNYPTRKMPFVEIQSMYNFSQDGVTQNVHDNRSMFFVDRSVMTFHSPEIEFDESIQTLPKEDFKVRIIGAVPFDSFSSKYFVDAPEPKVTFDGDKGIGFVNNSNLHTHITFGSHNMNCGYWNDTILYNDRLSMRNFHLFPFQRKGSLINYEVDVNSFPVKPSGHTTAHEMDITETSVLSKKVFSNILVSSDSIYYGSNNLLIHSLEFTNDSNVVPVVLKKGTERIIYYPTVNTLTPLNTGLVDNNGEAWGAGPYGEEKTASPAYHDIRGYEKDEDPLHLFPNDHRGWQSSKKGKKTYGSYILTYMDGSDVNTYRKGMVAVDSVPLKFRSMPHIVLNTDWFNNGGDNLLTNIFNDTNRPYLYLAEIYRDIDEDNRFGGVITNKTVVNNYIPCGPTADLRSSSPIIVYGVEGDYYYMRYDCLKTYSFTEEDINQIVEIASFMCETKVNIDGRWDRNRGLLDNTTISNVNFNRLNHTYTQSNNFFTYTTLNDLSSELNKFTNQITWTKTKNNGDLIDQWTNITLASVADAIGTYGQITKLLNFNDNLLMFQEHAIAVLGFDEKTMIPVTNGVPLELANSGKFTGFNYQSNDFGCQNKWSISVSKNGLFFIDDSRQELLGFSQDITSLSSASGLQSLFIQQLPQQFVKWNPSSFENFVTYYDKLGNDVLYINKDICLAWNEEAKTFTSFYDYNNTPYMSNIGHHLLMWHGNPVVGNNITTIQSPIWAAREYGFHSYFFGQFKPYWMTIVCDGSTKEGNAFPADKVFNNIEYRADIFNRIDTDPRDNVNTLDPSRSIEKYNLPIFNLIAAYNGYQVYKEHDINSVRRFNVWRVQLPRASYFIDGTLTTTRDRVRNTFTYIKLLNDNPMTNGLNRVILHDLAVSFSMR